MNYKLKDKHVISFLQSFIRVDLNVNCVFPLLIARLIDKIPNILFVVISIRRNINRIPDKLVFNLIKQADPDLALFNEFPVKFVFWQGHPRCFDEFYLCDEAFRLFLEIMKDYFLVFVCFVGEAFVKKP